MCLHNDDKFFSCTVMRAESAIYIVFASKLNLLLGAMHQAKWKKYSTRLQCKTSHFFLINYNVKAIFGIIVWNNILSSGVPVGVSQAVYSKQLKCAIINGTLQKSHAWNISMMLITSYVNLVINAGDISFHSAIYVERNLEMVKYLQQ